MILRHLEAEHYASQHITMVTVYDMIILIRFFSSMHMHAVKILRLDKCYDKMIKTGDTCNKVGTETAAEQTRPSSIRSGYQTFLLAFEPPFAHTSMN